MKNLKDFILEDKQSNWLKKAQQTKTNALRFLRGSDKKQLGEPIFVEDRETMDSYYAIPFGGYKLAGSLIGLDENGMVASISIFDPGNMLYSQNDMNATSVFYIDGFALAEIIDPDYEVITIEDAIYIVSNTMNATEKDFTEAVTQLIRNKQGSAVANDREGEVAEMIHDNISEKVEFNTVDSNQFF